MDKALLEVRQKLLKPRSGFIFRGVSIDECETIWLHWLRTCNASIAVIEWTPHRVVNHDTFPIKCLTHDWVEWDEEDYTPHCDISPQEKKRLEKESLLRLRLKLWSRFSAILDLTEEYLDWTWDDNDELFLIDKALAGVWWLDYERLWYTWMDDFHPYALERLQTSKYHTRVYEILLEKEFKTVDYFTQYFTLLRLAGDYEKFREKMNFRSWNSRK